MVSSSELKAECLRRRYARLLENADTFPSSANWAYIIEHKMSGLGPALYRKYLVARMLDDELRSGLHASAIRHFPEYLRAVDRNHALDTLYGDATTCPEAFLELVDKCELFDACRLMALLEFRRLDLVQLVVGALKSFQPHYDLDSLRSMRALLVKLKKAEALGRIEEQRSIMGIKNRFVCPNGHSSNCDNEFCPDCGCDIFGLRQADYLAIDEFSKRCDALEDLLR